MATMTAGSDLASNAESIRAWIVGDGSDEADAAGMWLAELLVFWRRRFMSGGGKGR